MNQEKTQAAAAMAFANEWSGKGYEKGESQTFWLTLLSKVYGVREPEKYIHFEEQVQLDKTSFIDAYIDATHVMIEQKSKDKDLAQSHQAERRHYAHALSASTTLFGGVALLQASAMDCDL